MSLGVTVFLSLMALFFFNKKKPSISSKILSYELQKPSYKSACRKLSKKAIDERVKDKEFFYKTQPIDLVMETLEGTVYDPTCLKDKPLIFHLWEKWCSPCIPEMFEYGGFAKKHKKDFYFIAASGGEKEKIPEYVRKNFPQVLPYVQFVYRNHLLDHYFREDRGILRPNTYVFNKEGHLVYESFGPVMWEEDFFKKIKSRLSQ